jgi:hypothetical protein
MTALTVTLAVREASSGALAREVTIAPGTLGASAADYVEPRDLAFSPDGRRVLVAGRLWSDRRPFYEGGTFIANWDLGTGEVASLLSGAGGLIALTGWWPDGSAQIVRVEEPENLARPVAIEAWAASGDLETRAHSRTPAMNAVSLDGTQLLQASGVDPAGRLEPLKLISTGGAVQWTYPNGICRPRGWQPAEPGAAARPGAVDS